MLTLLYLWSQVGKSKGYNTLHAWLNSTLENVGHDSLRKYWRAKQNGPFDLDNKRVRANGLVLHLPISLRQLLITSTYIHKAVILTMMMVMTVNQEDTLRKTHFLIGARSVQSAPADKRGWKTILSNFVTAFVYRDKVVKLVIQKTRLPFM